ncbi:S-layer homology domain-containing protein [Paenibacillus sp. P25]|nr:S-layer homology domain-containing protein [Paenibacillus sp. P25]
MVTPSAMSPSTGVESKTTKETTPSGEPLTHVSLECASFQKALNQLKTADNNNQTVTVTLPQDALNVQVDIPGCALIGTAKQLPNAVISVVGQQVSYRLPLQILPPESLANSWKIDPDKLSFQLTIRKVTGLEKRILDGYILKNELKPLDATYDFQILAVAGDRKEELNDFGTTYVTRDITIPGQLDPNKSSVFMVDPNPGIVSFVPAVFTVENGNTVVSVKRNGNSIYTVVTNDKTFGDLQNHWAKKEIELLASKGLVKGASDVSFAPDRSISRAEYVALLVRALGLKPDASAVSYKDVTASDWFAAELGAAQKAGLVNGYEDGTFRPHNIISRQEMAVLLLKATRYAGIKFESNGQNTQSLQSFKDKGLVERWAQSYVDEGVRNGLLQGASDGYFLPNEKASRAQAVVVLARMLRFAGFIN